MFLKLHVIWSRVEICELDTVNTQPLLTWMDLLLNWHSLPVGWHIPFSLLLEHCSWALGMGHPWDMWNEHKCVWVEYTRSVTRPLPVNLGVSWGLHLVLPGVLTSCCFSRSQGNLSVCPIWSRPAAWLEEESRISSHCSCHQTGSGLRQQDRDRYCVVARGAWLLSCFVVFTYSLILGQAVIMWDWAMLVSPPAPAHNDVAWVLI